MDLKIKFVVFPKFWGGLQLSSFGYAPVVVQRGGTVRLRPFWERAVNAHSFIIAELWKYKNRFTLFRPLIWKGHPSYRPFPHCVERNSVVVLGCQIFKYGPDFSFAIRPTVLTRYASVRFRRFLFRQNSRFDHENIIRVRTDTTRNSTVTNYVVGNLLTSHRVPRVWRST